MESTVTQPRLLVADADHEAAQAASAILKPVGFRVTMVTNGRAAQKELANGCAGLVLDLTLPGVNVYQLIENIRAKKGLEFPVIVWTDLPLDPSWAENLNLTLISKSGLLGEFARLVYQAFRGAQPFPRPKLKG